MSVQYMSSSQTDFMSKSSEAHHQQMTNGHNGHNGHLESEVINGHGDGDEERASALEPVDDEYLQSYESVRSERDAIQKKTFTKWCNHYLARFGKTMEDLFDDFGDGRLLVTLIESLTGEILPRERGNMQVHRLARIQSVLDFLKRRGVPLINLHSQDIAKGTPKLCLGLCWSIIYYVKISDIIKHDESVSFKEALLKWAQRTCEGYPGVKVTDFTTSWRDGLAFSAILHRNRPDLLEYRSCRSKTSRENLDHAFSVAERDLGLTRLLDPEDVDTAHPDEKSIVTYLSGLYEMFPNPPTQNPLMDEQKIRRVDEYKELATRLMAWIRENITRLNERNFPDSLQELRELQTENRRFASVEIPPKQHDKQRLAAVASEIERFASQLRQRLDSDLHIENIERWWNKLVAAHQEREDALAEMLEKAQNFNERLQSLATFLNYAEDKFRSMGPIGADIGTVRRQMKDLSHLKGEMETHSVDIESLNRQASRMKSPAARSQAEDISRRWEELMKAMAARQKDMETALTRLGHFEGSLQEMLNAIAKHKTILDTVHPTMGDSRSVERDLAKLKQVLEFIDDNQSTIDSLNHAGELIIEADTQGSYEVRVKLDNLNAKWQELIDEASAKRRKAEEISEAMNRLNANFQDYLRNLREFLDYAEQKLRNMDAIGSDVETVRRQMKELSHFKDEIESHKSEVDSANRQATELLEMSTSSSQSRAIREPMDEINRRWQELLRAIGSRQRDMDAALARLGQFEGSLQEMLNAIAKHKTILDTVHLSMGDARSIDRDLDKLKQVFKFIDESQTEIDRLNRAGEAIIEADTRGSYEVRARLENLNTKWQELIDEAFSKQRKAEEIADAMEKMSNFHDYLRTIREFLEYAENKLRNLGPIGAEVETVRRQMKELSLFKNEVEPHMVEVESANQQAAELLEMSMDVSQSRAIREPINDINRRWDELLRGIVARQNDLEQALLKLGQFQHALQEMLAWIAKTDASLDAISPTLGDARTIELDLAKLNVIQRYIDAHQASLDSLNKAGRLLIEADSAASSEVSHKLDDLNRKWKQLLEKAKTKQRTLEEMLAEAQSFSRQVQELLSWLNEMDSQLSSSKAVGGLPETAREQLDQFMVFNQEIERNRTTVERTIEKGAEYLRRSGDGHAVTLEHNLKSLRQKWETLLTRVADRRSKLETALREAMDFHQSLQSFNEWLSAAEAHLNNCGGVSRVVEIVQHQIEEHRSFQREVSERREEMMSLDKKGTHLKYYSQKTDVAVIKTSLTSVQHRWEKILSRSSERARALDNGLKEARAFHEAWSKMIHWLDEAQREFDASAAEMQRSPALIKQMVIKHKEFQRTLAGKQVTYESVLKMGRGLKDKAPRTDHPTLQDMMDELRRKWEDVCSRSLDRQRSLEEALLFDFDFDEWRRRFLAWMANKKARIMDFFRNMDKDADGKVPNEEFMQAFLASRFPTSRAEMERVTPIFDRNSDGFVDHKEWLDTLRPDRQGPKTEDEIIMDEVQRQVAKCTCVQRYKVHHVGDGQYRFGESQKLRLVRILRSTVMVRVGGGWVSLDEFLIKNDPCRAKGRTNVELREQFILPEGASQAMTAFRSKRTTSPSPLPTQGPIMKIREKTERSIPMSVTWRGSAQASPSDLSEGDSGVRSRPRSRLTATPGSRPVSRQSNMSQESISEYPTSSTRIRVRSASGTRPVGGPKF